jgi:hypothetical protein
MLAASSGMSYLGDATAGIAFAVAMALVAMAAGRRPAFVAVSLVAAIVVAVGLSTIVPNMSNAWKVWDGSMDGAFAGLDQARTAKALLSGDNALLGCGVGRISQAMLDAPFGVAWPLMMSVGTFGSQGFIVLAAAAVCSFAVATKTLRDGNGGVALAFVAVSMAVALLIGLLASCAVLPDLGTCDGLMFLCLDSSACIPLFMVLVVSLAFGRDVAMAHAMEKGEAVALLPPNGDEE